MGQLCIWSFLGVNSYLDARHGQVSLRLVAIYGILGVFYIFWHRQQWQLLVLGAMPGLLLLCMGRASGGALGMGDGLVVLVAGLYLGIWKVLEFLTLALLLAAAWAGFLMVVRKKGRKASFPFVPFLLAAYAGIWLTRAVEGWKG